MDNLSLSILNQGLTDSVSCSRFYLGIPKLAVLIKRWSNNKETRFDVCIQEVHYVFLSLLNKIHLSLIISSKPDSCSTLAVTCMQEFNFKLLMVATIDLQL